MMAIFVKLFIMFVKLSLFSFGGGYVMIPIMMDELEKNQLLDTGKVTDLIALAGMSPGPVAINAAVALGYKVNSFLGVLAAFLGIAIPCAVIVIIAAKFFFKIYNKPVFKSVLYGIRPVIIGIIIFAAVKIGIKNGIFFSNTKNIIENGFNIIIKNIHLLEIKSFIILVTSLFLMIKTNIHPIILILCGALVGIIAF